MGNYRYEAGRFVIRDYQNQKTFASFLPALAGEQGKPLWAFYANVGQAMGGFGISSKETPITPFDSANLAYANIPLKGFRTFAKVDGAYLEPFLRQRKAKREMSLSQSDVEIYEENDSFSMKVAYYGIPSRSYAGLVREVTFVNRADHAIELEFIDGLPVFFPHGLSNFCYKELVSLMAAYCEVHRLEEKTPFVKFKTSTGDHAQVEEAKEGNGFFAIDQNGDLLSPIVDPEIVFAHDATNLLPEGYLDASLEETLGKSQQIENKLPCAFLAKKLRLAPGESYSYAAVFGHWESLQDYLDALEGLSFEAIRGFRKQNEELLSSLLSPATSETAYPLFDECLKQSYLDNNLRGGFPTLLGNQVYYLYGRKHGDMERDYNAFDIPSCYYSSGPGNFRDVNQNRRNDLFFAPFVKDYNIKTFFSLLQIDGQNPLTVKPNSFSAPEKVIDSLPSGMVKDKAALAKLLNDFCPTDLYSLLRDQWQLEKKEADFAFKTILNAASQHVEACFGEGYWVDHWTYNVDLLENYSSIYPDQEENLFFGSDYPYFHSPVYVQPRTEKYCLIEEGKVRQYGAIDLKGLKEECEREGIDIRKTDWLRDEKGNIIHTNLAGKILHTIYVKFSTLDSLQMGIEMECEKPGWNDAMNGLPGLFASGLSESIELLRLLRYAKAHLAPFGGRSLTLMRGQAEFFRGLEETIKEFECKKLTRFAYWDKATSLREALRLRYRHHGEAEMVSFPLSEALDCLSKMEAILVDGIVRAKEAGQGILPSYLIYRLEKYEKTGHINHLGYETVKPLSFVLETIPPFLEASARALKLGDEFLKEKDLDAIKATSLYDDKLHFYKTCGDIDDAPFEIGRVHAFTKGWLERECNFLHMDYKFLLGLLKGGFLDRFYDEVKTNWTLHLDPEVYGRNPVEASSFIVPTCNPDASKHGRGYFARLTGANAEFLNMFVLLFAGERLFSYENGELKFHLRPLLSSAFFDAEGKASFTLFGKTKVTYVNPSRKDLKGNETLRYTIEGKTYETVGGKTAEDIREGRIKEIIVEVL